ncbi:MAG: hypothetical protein RMK29_15765 [Myxococcales bacterium]|nr:hypothetical protein [Myxococcales bacterium]
MVPRFHLALIVASFLACALLWLITLGGRVPLSYAEGDTATWIWLLRRGYNLYTEPTGLPLWQSNYPPLFLHLVAALAPSDSEIVRTGGVVSLAGFVLAMALLGACAHAATGSRLLGWVAALLLGGTLFVSYHAATCLPDAPALALGLGGITLVALRVRGWPLLAPVAFVAAVMMKHSLVVLPLGTLAWALRRAPRQGLVLALGTAGLVGWLLWRQGLFAPLVLWTMADWSPLFFLSQCARFVLPWGAGLAVAVLLLGRWAQLPAHTRQVLGPFAGALLVGLPWTLVLGRCGSGSNHTMELLTAMCLHLTIAMAGCWWRRAVLLHLLVTCCMAVGGAAYLALVRLPGVRQQMAYTRAQLQGRSGPVLAESTWYTTALGRPPVVVPFLATNLARRGQWDPSPLLRALRAGQIERLVLHFPLEEPPGGGHDERFLPEVLAVARARYQLLGQQRGVYVYGPLQQEARPHGSSPRGGAAAAALQDPRPPSAPVIGPTDRPQTALQ